MTWTSTNASYCSSYWTNSSATSGSGVVTPTSTTTYTTTCYNSSGQSAAATATVYVNQAQIPTVTLTANPSSIQSGGNSTLTWTSTNASYCSSYWTNSSATSGSGVVTPTSTTTYTTTCYNSSGQSAAATATVYVNQAQIPTVNIYANPTSVNYNGSSTLTWNSNNATSCSASNGTNGWSGNRSTSGTFYTGVLTYTTTFEINCTGSTGQQAYDSVTIYVNNNQNNYSQTSVSISADQTNIPYNGSTIIRWYPINATSCYGSGGSNGWATTQSAYSSSFNTGPLTYTTTYTISCSNYNNNYYNNNYYNSGSATQSVTVSVGNYGNQIQTINSLTATTTAATQILNTSAQLNSLIANSGSNPANAWFEWGTTINLGNKTTTTAVGALPSVLHVDTLTGLNSGTIYYFRAVAENSSWRSVGSILSFTTNGQQNTTVVRYVQRTTAAPTSLVLITSSVDRNQPIVPTIDNTRPHPGDEINYTANYQNIGTGAITNLTLQIVLPPEVDYISSTPNNPIISGNSISLQPRNTKSKRPGRSDSKSPSTRQYSRWNEFEFPRNSLLFDPSGQPQSVSANVSAQVWSAPSNEENASSLGANVFWAGFLARKYIWLASFAYS